MRPRLLIQLNFPRLGAIKLAKAEANRSALSIKLAEAEEKLAAAWDEVVGEKARAEALKKSLEDLDKWFEEEKAAAVAAFKDSTKFAVSMSDYYYSGFDTFHRRQPTNTRTWISLSFLQAMTLGQLSGMLRLRGRMLRTMLAPLDFLVLFFISLYIYFFWLGVSVWALLVNPFFSLIMKKRSFWPLP